MKKLCVLLAAMILISVAGCDDNSISEQIINEMVEKTYTAIENNQVDVALTYGKTAIQEGHDDDDFADLLEGLELYLDVKEALDKNDLKAANDYYDEIAQYNQSAISDLIADFEQELSDKTKEVNDIIQSLEYAVENDEDDDAFITSSQTKLDGFVLTEEQELKLEEIIEAHKNKPDEVVEEVYYPSPEEINGYVDALEKAVEDYDQSMVASMMVKLTRLEAYLNEHQRKRTYIFWDDWNNKQKQIEPGVYVSADEAIEIARKALNLSDEYSIVAVQCGEYYIIRAEAGFGDYINECGCNVSTYDGEVFGQIG